MGKRGPPKKPTELKLLQGNPGKRPISPDEPRPERAAGAAPPQDLDETGRAIWQEIAPRLERLGLLTEIDLSTFGRYCDMRGKFKAAKEFLDKNGFYYAIHHEQTPEEIAQQKKPRLRYMAQFPQVAIYQQLAKELTRLEQNFGMTPSARAGLNVEPAGVGADSDRARLLGGW